MKNAFPSRAPTGKKLWNSRFRFVLCIVGENESIPMFLRTTGFPLRDPVKTPQGIIPKASEKLLSIEAINLKPTYGLFDILAHNTFQSETYASVILTSNPRQEDATRIVLPPIRQSSCV